jgi:hypothetical protein
MVNKGQVMTIINNKCDLFEEPKNKHLDPKKLLKQPDRLNPMDRNLMEDLLDRVNKRMDMR